jgi:molybdenum cofactor cytidylyltransferase
MNVANFAAVILAAGFSTRMNRLKPLLPLGEATITDFVVSTFKNLGVDPFIVVGNRKEEIIKGINSRVVTIVDNPDFEQGMFSSVQAGIKQLHSKYQGFFVLPVDIPLVKAATIKAIMDTFTAHSYSIVYPAFQGHRGHPPLIPSSLIPGLLSWKQDGGLKAFLMLNDRIAINVPVNDRFILFDIDTPEDYMKMRTLNNDNGSFLKDIQEFRG